MNDPLQELQAMVEALRADVESLKSKVKLMEKVVTVEMDDDGRERRYVECESLVVRDAQDPRWIAINLGACKDGGFINFHFTGEEDRIKTALSLGMAEDGEPHVRVFGRDWKTRVELTTHQDMGLVAVLGTNETPGAVMRAQPTGGSVAVLQADGKTRGVLMHCDKMPADAVVPEAETVLLFANELGETQLKLHADAEGSFMGLGSEGKPNEITLVARGGLPSIVLEGPGKSSSVSLLAGPNRARVSAHQGTPFDKQAEARLEISELGGEVSLRESTGEERVNLMATDGMGRVALIEEEGKEGVVLVHSAGRYSALGLQGPTGKDCVRLIVGVDVAGVQLESPLDARAKVLLQTGKDGSSVMVHAEDQVRAVMGEAENCGVVSAYGPGGEKAGMASLSGGPLAGGMVVATADGTRLVEIGGTDHGGYVTLNNDLGFPRIAMGVYEESAGVHLNHTGNQGVNLVATPLGGVVTVCDAEGKMLHSLPPPEEE